jgi:hypothetical protein
MKQLFFHLFATSAFAEAKTETGAAPIRDGVNLGIDRTRWTRRLLGREDRLTHVYGSVVKEILR